MSASLPPDPPLDLRQLRILRAVLHHQSVSRAADALGQSQPAVSATLRKLRAAIGDPLLVRSGAAMVPTERAQAIAATIETVLAGIDTLTAPPPPFDPATATGTIRIVAYLGLGALLIPALIAAFRERAPLMRLEFLQPPPPEQVEHRLETGEIDLLIGNWQAPFPSLRFAPLINSDMLCMLDAAHPMAGTRRFTLEQYLALAHVSPSPATSLATTPIDGLLAQLGHRRTIAVTIPEYALAQHIVPGSDLVFTTARPLAEALAEHLPVRLVAAPPELGTLRAFCFWHEKTHHGPFGTWLRDAVKSIARALDDRRPAPSITASA